MKKALLLCSCLLFCVAAIARENNTPTPQQFANKKAPLSFMENKGQITDQNYQPRPDIQFQLKAANGLTIFVGDGAIHYQFAKSDKMPEARKPEDRFDPQKMMEQDSTTYTMYRMDVELVGANKHAKIITEDKQDYYENYYTTGTGENGATVYAYSKITYKDIYPNIDWVLYTRNNELKHEFIVKQGGNPADIKLKYGGATNLQLQNDGSLEAATPQGTITEQAPVSYTQEGQQVKSSFVLKENVLSYEVGNYEGTLVIDPSLVWGTYFGGGTGTYTSCSRVITFPNGNVIFTGNTTATTSIATTGAYDVTYNYGYADAYIAQFNSAGQIIWATYYGGSGDEFGAGIVYDTYGNLYVLGETTSTNNIATTGAYQTVLNLYSTPPNYYDNFIVKFNSAGQRQWGTYYGGNNDEHSQNICIDKYNNIFITGYTKSTNGIATTGSHQTTYSGSSILAFIAEFNTNGQRVWGTYYGGNSGTSTGVIGSDITADTSGNIYIVGTTSSNAGTSGISTSGAYQIHNAGGYDVFLTKFNNLGVRQWGTYFGGNNDDWCIGICLDATGNIYLTGKTASTTGIATVGAYKTTITNTTSNDAFLTKFSNSGQRLWSTYFGGESIDEGNGIKADNQGHIYISGNSLSHIGIATIGAIKSTIDSSGYEDNFIARFSSNGTFLWGTYYGGNLTEYRSDICLSGDSVLFLLGVTYSDSGIATYGAYQTAIGGTGLQDAYLVKLSFLSDYPIVGSINGISSICVGNSTTLIDTTSGGVWSSSNSNVVSINNSGFITGNSSGNSTISYTVSNANFTVSKTKIITVNALPTINAGTDQTICAGTSVILSGSGATNYSWNGGVINNQSFVPNATANYVLTGIDGNGCSNKDTVLITVNPLPTINAGADVAVCTGNNISLNATSNASNISWNNSVVNNQSFTPSISGNYIVTATNTQGCTNSDTVIVTVNPLPTVNAVTDQVVCIGNSTTLSATGTATNYSWTGGVTNNQSFMPTSTNNYVVTGTDANGCSKKDTAVITVNPLPNVNAGANQTVCAGSSVTLTATGATAYSWNNGVVNNQSFIPQTTQTYSVTGTDANNCSNTSIVQVTVNPLPSVNAGVDQTICAGTSITLSGSGATSYSWSGGINNNQGFVPLISNSYLVTGTDVNGCINKDTVVVTVNPLPTVNAGADQNVCSGNSTILSATGAINYSWSGGITNNQSFTPATASSYVVTGTDANGCSNKDTVYVAVNPYPVALASTYQPAICPNGNTTLTASGGTTYLWSNGDTATTTTVNQAGNYYVIATNEFGCSDTSNTVAITQKTLPTTIKIKFNGASAVCAPGTVAYVLDMPLGSTTGFAYQWYVQGSAIPGATDSFYNANTTGSYALAVSGGSNCLKYSYPKTATIKAAPTASFSATSATTICTGGFVVLVAPSITGYTYTWLKDGAVAGTGPNMIFKVSGNYTVIAKINGCSDTANPTMPVIVNPLPVASISALNATTFCAGDSCTLAAQPAGAVYYEWHNGNYILDTTTTPLFNIGSTATIKVLVKDANGCIGKLSSTNVKTKVNSIPLASISTNGSTTISSIGSVKLKAMPTAGVFWQWYKNGNMLTGSTGNQYTATSGGSYTVAITKLGCTGVSTPVIVTQTSPKEEVSTASMNEGSFELSAYPNPVSEVLTVSVSGLNEVNGTIQVLDVMGKVVKSFNCKEGENQFAIDSRQWASGIYFIRYKDEMGRTGTVKVVKE